MTTWQQQLNSAAVETSCPFLAWLEVNDPDAAAWARLVETQGPVFDVRACRVCGCTDDNACQPFSCWWVAENLCSECA
jgi:hypothetical protein